MENGLNSQMVFQAESLQFNCGAAQGPAQRRVREPERKTREASGFVGEKLFSVEGERYFGAQSGEFRRSIFGDSRGRRGDRADEQNWNGDGSAGTPSGNGSDGDDDDEDDDEDDEDEDDEVDEGDGEVEGLVAADESNKNNNNNSNGSVNSSPEKMCGEKGDLQKLNSTSFGSSRGMLMKEGNAVHSVNSIRGGSGEQQHQHGRVNHYDNAVTIAEPDMYYLLTGPDGSNLGHKEIGGENGCGYSGRKDVSLIMDSGESLRAILSDPITGTLMDDAMILPCGHSFGSSGMQHVIRMKACYTCSHPVSEDSVAPNLSLRSAIQAFRHEEELQSHRVSKKRRERMEQEKSGCGDASMYLSRGKGVQFPFAVTDRVIIKGNKRTPLRFVGREAVVTTQCLNGWYVVKTLDNAESVKLQYRSLAKVSESPPLNAISNKTATPNWL
ncbi:hypothetical protein Scep_005877 [Stephania cephalantha]|uniref:U-box domain-containing protein n=1 Tax=Stephania cephalantha TaxID=152367 RepID=A0AAP0KWL9_9MAGN